MADADRQVSLPCPKGVKEAPVMPQSPYLKHLKDDYQKFRKYHAGGR